MGAQIPLLKVSETLAVVLSVLTWSIPWVTGRLEEASLASGVFGSPRSGL